MRVAKITTDKGEIYYSNKIDALFSDFCVEIIEMTESEYKAIPATMESKEFFTND